MSVLAHLHFELFQPGDFIIREGAVGDKMFFIDDGVVDVLNGDGVAATSLSDGSYFGGTCTRRSLLKSSSQRLDRYNKIKHTKHTIR